MALDRNMLLIPVFFEDTPMPKPEDLPASIRRLTRFQAVDISDRRFNYDVGRLVDFLNDKVEPARPQARSVHPQQELTFADVPTSHWAWRYVRALAAAGLVESTDGRYCPTLPVTRAEMAVVLIRAIHGASFIPPAATDNRFDDAPVGFWASPYIEQLAADGITHGCDPKRFCPASPISRAEMAVFLLRAKHGANYKPSPGTGTRFFDVPAGHWALDWIEKLATEGISTGCAPRRFCPDDPVSRDQMAVFLALTFNLPLP